MGTLSIVENLKTNRQDFEWYPTTSEIIDCISKDIEDYKYGTRAKFKSILDCGAGDGRVLQAIDIPKKYAIEKSQILIQQQSKDIFVVGTDFHQQTLLDKNIDVLFCNPPYSEFKEWAVKILSQTQAHTVYLVLPQRWDECPKIEAEIKNRGWKVSVLLTTDFLSADRRARAKVNVIKAVNHNSGDEAFSKWFDDNFNIKTTKPKTLAEKIEDETIELSKVDSKNSLTTGDSLIHILVALYNRDLDYLLSNLKAICELDSGLFEVMGVNIPSLKASLKLKIEETKNKYWRELFDRFYTITQRLTVKNRAAMLEMLFENTSVDFTYQNAQAIVIWVVKNANSYLDSQLTDTFKKLVSDANVIKYKSNENTIKKEKWRYINADAIGKFYLDYRIVLENNGGIEKTWRGRELSERTANTLKDILVVAHNLGYNISSTVHPNTLRWVAGQAQVFKVLCYRTGKELPLMEVRAFLNGNVHIKFDNTFMLRWSVEFGRLSGWVKDAKDMAHEMDKPIEEIAGHFGCNLNISQLAGAMLLEKI